MSFGLSRGRSLDTSGIAVEEDQLGRWDDPRIDPRQWFEHADRPLEIEIGSGKGTFLVQQARSQPETNFLGVEWSGEFCRFAADRIRRHGLSSVRMLHCDATDLVSHRCRDGVAAVVHLYFTDPWPKKRHHKRRFVQDASLRALHGLLAPGGLVHLVTDHPDLWAWYEAHAERAGDIFDRTDFTPPASAGEGEVVGTNFERKYRDEGRAFHAMTLVRRGDP